jgi:hypothetical protein
MEPTSSLNRGERRKGKKGSSLVTGSEVQSQANGASCFITTDSEKSLVSRQASQVEQIELRTYVFLDSLQPQLAAYMGTVSRGFLPIPGDSCLWMEVSPGMAVHRVTDIALKASNVRLGQMIVERAFELPFQEIPPSISRNHQGLVKNLYLQFPYRQLTEVVESLKKHMSLILSVRLDLLV